MAGFLATLQGREEISHRSVQVLARYYGFTEENELDFIINHEIKYRMGQGGGETDPG